MWKVRCSILLVCVFLFTINLTAISNIEIQRLGTYQSGIYDESAAEIVVHDPTTHRLYVVNANSGNIDVLDINTPSMPTHIFQIDVSTYGKSANSVAIYNGVLAVAIEADPKQSPGTVVFFNQYGVFLNMLTVGPLPDMLTFTPDGLHLLVANEGEPDEYCQPGEEGDPEGSVSVINLMNGVGSLTQDDVLTADFKSFTRENIHPDIRIFGPNATVAQDLEPEYIAVDPDSTRAWVTLQENNAIAMLDIASATITNIFPLGYKDYSNGGGLDPSDRDDGINIANWHVKGMYQPDAIVAFKVSGETFLLTANEGDARDYDCFSEEVRVEDLDLDPTVFENAEDLQESEKLGRLKTTTATGDSDGDGLHETIFNYGARSFSIWSADGNLIYDSGSDFEQLSAELLPDDFNSNNDQNDTFDNRSDDKGPEPECVTIGKVGDRLYAFVGLERVGGIMVYDVSNPYEPYYVQYVNNRDFTGDAEAGTAGDLGPEGILFINAEDSPTGFPLLVTGNEVSGTTTVFSIMEIPQHVFSLNLVRGLNIISLPLKPKKPHTAKTLLEKLSATVLIRLNTEKRQFDGFTADAPDNGFKIVGGQAYIVNVPSGKRVEFEGYPWMNHHAAPGVNAIEGKQRNWAFVVSGRFLGAEGYTVSATNIRTRKTVSDIVKNGYFAATYGDMLRNTVVSSGDVLEIRVSDTEGNTIGEPKVYTITSNMLDKAFISVSLNATPLPQTAMLLQNYPNPFNPETWIPYQLSEAAQVKIFIYDVLGNVVRSLDLGHHEAGYYHTRSQAAYWDGKNDLNEHVASGVYFYQIQASDFSETRSMLILK